MSQPDTDYQAPKKKLPRWTRAFIGDLLLIGILLLAVYFRTVGVDWDAGEHLHPDERFLTMVESAMTPVNSLAEYFNTSQSTLNPHNVGYTYFVYGTLPMFLVRYVAEWVNQAGYGQIELVGRQLSALADCLTVFLVYLIGTRLYNRRVGLLAAAFSAFAALQIQLSHYFTVDNFTNLFTFLAIYAAVRILTPVPGRRPGRFSWEGFFNLLRRRTGYTTENGTPETGDPAVQPQEWNLAPLWEFLLFGLGLGMAMASKVSAFPLAFLLPAAVGIQISRLSPAERQRQFYPALISMALAGLVSFFTFRIFQPYAFTGPGIFGLKINPLWMQNLRDLAAQSGADSDAPYALQWARRPLSFAWTNMVEWGLGLPLGILAWAGVVWMGWRCIKGEWRQHSLLWLWTVMYFIWQSVSWVRSMRYQILVYPTLAIMAAWLVVYLWDKGNQSGAKWGKWIKAGALIVGTVAVAGSLAWAFAFTRIYTRPCTRVAASAWIYQNLSAPINLSLENSGEMTNVPLYYPMGARLQNQEAFSMVFQPDRDGILTQINLPHVYDLVLSEEFKLLKISIAEEATPESILTDGVLQNAFTTSAGSLGDAYSLSLTAPVALRADTRYVLTFVETANTGTLLVSGAPELSMIDPTTGDTLTQKLPMLAQRITAETPYVGNYLVPETGTLTEVYFPHLVDQLDAVGEKTLRVTVMGISAGTSVVSTASVTNDFLMESDSRGNAFTFVLDQPLEITANETVMVMVEMVSGSGAIAVYGDSIGIEYPWDDPIPLGLGKYSAYDSYNMMFRSDLAFDTYTTDSAEKRERFVSILDNSDYVIITSNRQWGSTVRVPERYPMTREYYRALVGCPADKDILQCYSDAQPGMYTGELGFELEAVYQSNPNLGSIEFNDQLAEEAFTVYDHPKVLIFHKTENYSHDNAEKILSSVDLSGVVAITPRRVTGVYKDLLLTASRWITDQASGTWSALFDSDGIINRCQPLTVVVWYLAIFLLGLMVYPLVRLGLPGLSDRGYPLSRTVGLLLFAWIAWLCGSAGLEVSRGLLLVVVLAILLLSIGLGYLQRKELAQELRTRGRYFLAVELVSLLFFAIMLGIRLGNPDLWHPAKGGEKPMDFSFFNAVLRSTTFPPYDPWYAGGYINYYYYGYVIVGMPVKLLGIVPSVAYNLILPTLFSTLALGGFSAVWNITNGKGNFWPADPRGSDDNDRLSSPVTPGEKEEGDTSDRVGESRPDRPVSLRWIVRQKAFLMGLAGACGLVILGNLGTVRMVWYGLQKLAAPGGVIDGANIFTRLWWTAQGIWQSIQGATLPYGYGDWYWIPSRAIPAGTDVQPITEFPSFTFLYADLHAHMIALPLTAFALVWVISVVLSRSRWGDGNGWRRWLPAACGLFIGGLGFGALRPTNTWDFPTYLLLAGIALAYTGWRYGEPHPRWLPTLPDWARKLCLGLAEALLLVAVSVIFYLPFTQWYAQAYNSVALWTGSRTPFWSYLTHWGLFLFVIVSWMLWETHRWMATTPMSKLLKLQPYMLLLQGLTGLVFLAMAFLVYKGVEIGWLAVPLGVWAAVLILRPNQSDAKRLVLFLFGTGLALTLFVELVVLKGDIGRMNTVFKYYLQVWTLFAVCAAASLGWLLDELKVWLPSWTPAWQGGLILLVFGAALFPITAGLDKVRDRMSAAVPQTLDGMAYMQTATYAYTSDPMDLSQDYRAIRWLQENVSGSPVIVEANLRDLYRWGSRMTIYTGLPGVVGWEWHEQQQRAILSPTLVTDRILEIESFYKTADVNGAEDFLKKYNVEYIVVGQLERETYPGIGLEKFAAQDGVLWNKVYEDQDTVIYQTSCGCTLSPAE